MMRLIGKYIEYLRYEKNYSSHTEISYSNDLHQFVAFLDAEGIAIEVDVVDSDIVRQWIVSLLESGKSARSVNRKLSSLKSFYSYLLRKGEIKINKISAVEGPKVAKPIPSFVPDANMSDILDENNFDDTFVSLRNRAILELFYLTGMRRAELIGLSDVDVDLSSDLVKVTGKRNKQRMIPIDSRLHTILSEYKIRRDAEVGGSEALFVREDGQGLYPMLVHRIVTESLGQIATLTKKSPHVLRHSFATSMLNNGADINAIKELLGHASLAATEIYTHTSLEELKNIYNNAHPRA